MSGDLKVLKFHKKEEEPPDNSGYIELLHNMIKTIEEGDEKVSGLGIAVSFESGAVGSCFDSNCNGFGLFAAIERLKARILHG